MYVQMTELEKVMSWLEGLAQDDWRQFHSDSEVSNIAKAALALLKEQENEEERILRIVWGVLHGCVSTDTVEDQDWVYEQIRNRVHPMY